MVTVFRSHGFYIFHFYIFHFYIYQLLLLFCFEVVEEEEKNSEKTKHIFISYNHTHQDVVRQVAERLKVSHTLYCEIYLTMVFKTSLLGGWAKFPMHYYTSNLSAREQDFFWIPFFNTW